MKARTQTEFAKRWVGVCEVKTGDSKAKITSVEVSKKDNRTKLLPNGELSMTVPFSDFPKAALKVIKPGMKEPKKFRIRLTEDGDAVDGVTPVNGVFPAKLLGLGPKKQDGSYSMIHKTFNEGTDKENSHDEFLALYEITEGVFKGVELPGYFLHYKFEEIPEGEEDEGFTRFNTADTPQASQLHKLQAWAETHGNVLDEPIRWPDDGIILDTIEERALDADRPVNLIFENGYIKSVQAIETYDDDVTDEEIDNAFPEADDDDEPEVVEVPAKSKGSKKVASPSAKKSVAKGKSAKDDDEDL